METQQEISLEIADLKSRVEDCKRWCFAALRAYGKNQIPFDILVDRYSILLSRYRNLFDTAQSWKRRLGEHVPEDVWTKCIEPVFNASGSSFPRSQARLEKFAQLSYETLNEYRHTITRSEAVWVEHLADLARLSNTLLSTNVHDDNPWGCTARYFYIRAIAIEPSLGRLYYHLGSVSPGNPVEELHWYHQSLACWRPHHTVGDGFRRLFSSTLASPSFVKLHKCLFEGHFGEIEPLLTSFLDSGSKIMEDWHGVFIASASVDVLLNFDPSPLTNALLKRPGLRCSGKIDERGETFDFGVRILSSIMQSALEHGKTSREVLPLIHVILAFVAAIAILSSKQAPGAMASILSSVPGKELCDFLNVVNIARVSGSWPREEFGTLPEDLLIVGKAWAGCIFPIWQKRTTGGMVDILDTSSHLPRIVRILTLASKLALVCPPNSIVLTIN